MHVNKTWAFIIHFSLSFLIFSLLFFVLYFVWFPSDYFMLDGGWQGIKLIAAIDLILGPALTLLLFKPGKPKLVLDMSIIAVIQIGALMYGFYAAYHQRTVGLVFAEREFTTLSYQDLLLANNAVEEYGLVPVDFNSLDSMSPRQIFTESLTEESYELYLSEVLNGMPSLRERTDKYKSLNEYASELSRFKLQLDEIKTPEMISKISKIAKSENKVLENYEFYRFRARYGSGVAMFDPVKKRVTRLIRSSEDST